MAPKKKTIGKPSERVAQSSDRVTRSGTSYGRVDQVTKKAKTRLNRRPITEPDHLPSGSVAAASDSDHLPSGPNAGRDSRPLDKEVGDLGKEEKGTSKSSFLPESEVSLEAMEVGDVSSKDEKRTATSVALPAHGAALTNKAKITTSKSHHQPFFPDDDDYDNESPDFDADDCYSDEFKGTSTLGFIFKEGVMLATDHYDCSADASDEFVPNAIALNKHVLVTVSGDILDTRSFLNDMRRQYLVEGISTVGKASEWVAKRLSSCREEGLTVEMLIAGWDKAEGFSLYHVNVEGKLCKGNGFATGAGSRYLFLCFGPSHFNEGMSYNEAEKFAKKSIRHSAHIIERSVALNDSGETGGFVSGYYIGVDVYKCVFRNEYTGKAAKRTRLQQIYGDDYVAAKKTVS